jgi:hypothetical protein
VGAHLSYLKSGIHAAEAGLPDPVSCGSKRETESRKEQKINCSNPRDFARSRAEVFPIANEAGGI